ncbi:hypothetical protein C4569_01670 [Candidatus Parcubacteria bacterium]|nr:MAG: hypothetical protein C4569_01670 [Candidatus Parcubacteria bacterium]
MPGKLIILYGTNNIGKSTQAKILVDRLKNRNCDTVYIKYPIYELEPTGPKLNKILRSGQPQEISELELQKLYARNRKDFEPELKKMLGLGKIIVAECYIGTGLAWGMTKGVPLEKLEEVNEDLLKEDVAILLDGQPFIKAREKNHLHENNNELMIKCRQNFLFLAKKYGWKIIDANQEIEKITEKILENISAQIILLTKSVN